MAATRYKHVSVTLGVGIHKDFDFEIDADEAAACFARITDEDYELVLDHELHYTSGNLPAEWRKPVVAKLMLLLKSNRHPDGTLS